MTIYCCTERMARKFVSNKFSFGDSIPTWYDLNHSLRVINQYPLDMNILSCFRQNDSYNIMSQINFYFALSDQNYKM